VKNHKAVQIITSNAAETAQKDKEFIRELLEDASLNADIDSLVRNLLNACDVTVNFHPDRFSNNGKLIIENLLTDGEYHNQYKTGTSNGGRTAYTGGDRDLWEKRLFFDAYHNGEFEMISRPKYGALNIHNYIDGASARFGSCFFTLKPHVTKRCTFAFGDSSSNPDVMGTSEQFYGIVKALLQNVIEKGELLGESSTTQQAADYILSMQKSRIETIGRNLDDCIETHIHGHLCLLEDIDSFYIDEHFASTEIEKVAKALSERYDIKLLYIPKRQFQINKIDDKWKGPLARPIADRINERFGSDGMLNAALIGLASQDSVANSENWLDLGTEYDLFQNFKYLWHYVARFG
jgi:hypothetical protein